MTEKSLFDHQFEGTELVEVQPYDFDDLKTQPTGFFKPAMEQNKKYAAALLKLSNRRAKRNRGKRGTTPADLARHRAENIFLVSKYCITGWENMKDIKGGEIEFSEENAREFLTALPHYMFDELYNWLQNPVNFRKEEDTDDIDLDDIASEFEEEDLETEAGPDAEEEGSLGKS